MSKADPGVTDVLTKDFAYYFISRGLRVTHQEKAPTTARTSNRFKVRVSRRSARSSTLSELANLHGCNAGLEWKCLRAWRKGGKEVLEPVLGSVITDLLLKNVFNLLSLSGLVKICLLRPTNSCFSKSERRLEYLFLRSSLGQKYRVHPYKGLGVLRRDTTSTWTWTPLTK